MNRKRLGTIIGLLVSSLLQIIYYYVSNNLVILGASEGIVAGSLIGYYAPAKRENSSQRFFEESKEKWCE